MKNAIDQNFINFVGGLDKGLYGSNLNVCVCKLEINIKYVC